MMNLSGDSKYLLEKARYDTFRHLLPVIVCMIVSGVAGIVGNILAFIFYTFKTKRASTVVLIACLSMVDVIVCLLFISNIAEMWVNVKYTQSFMCKLTHFIGLCAVACSGLILWVVAIDRHRKICWPFGKQMTLTTIKYAVIGIVIFGLTMSARNFANFDAVEVDVMVNGGNETVKGRYCTTRDDPSYFISVTVFTVTDFLLMLIVWFTLAIVYSHVIYTLYKLKRTRKRIQQRSIVGELETGNTAYEIEGIEVPRTVYKVKSGFVERDTQGYTENMSVPQVNKQCTKHETLDIGSNMENKISSEASAETGKSLNGKQGQGSKVFSLTIHYERLIDKSNTLPRRINSNESIATTGSSICDTQTSGDYLDDNSSSSVSEYLPDGEVLPSVSHAQAQVQPQAQPQSEQKTPRRKKHQKYNSSKSARERTLTFKMLTVSLLFIFCFTPYFIVKIWMREVLKTGEEYELSLWSQIALRLPYMNSVFNPIVYCVFNPQFRFYIKSVFTGFVSKYLCKRKNLT